MAEKVYNYERAKEYLPVVLACLITTTIFLLASFYTPIYKIFFPYLDPYPEKVAWMAAAVLFLLGALYFLIWLILGKYTERIIFTKKGMVLDRRSKPITIEKIINMEIKMGRRGMWIWSPQGETLIKITGLNAEEKEIRETIRRVGEVGERWERFKKDLERYCREEK